MSTFGRAFRVTTFGESHCRGVGVIIDGVPPQLGLTEADVQPQLTRRRPGQSRITTPRSEADRVTIMSGTEMGKTLGTPVAMFVANTNVRPGDYKEMTKVPRPGHADYAYQAKYGNRAASGGGRSSARETIGRVASGAVAEKWLRERFGTEVSAWVSAIGTVKLPVEVDRSFFTREEVDRLGQLRVLRDPAVWRRVDSRMAVAKGAGDSGGGTAGGGVEKTAKASSSSSSSSSSSTTATTTTSTGAVDELAAAMDSAHSSNGSGSGKGGKRKGGSSHDVISPQQKAIDEASEAAFVAEVRSGEGKDKPAYLDCDGNILTRDGDAYTGPPLSPAQLESWTTDELIPVRCPHPPTAAKMATVIRDVKADKDSTGGVVTGAARRVPVGLGEPCFDKLEAKLAHGMLSLPATKGFEIGSGFGGTVLRGSQHNDAFAKHPTIRGLLRTKTNNAGGTLGGISSGAPLLFRVAVKPVSTIGQKQATADFNGNDTVLEAKGRHDPCVLPRTPPLIEAMTALVLADAALLQLSRVGSASATPSHLMAGDYDNMAAATAKAMAAATAAEEEEAAGGEGEGERPAKRARTA